MKKAIYKIKANKRFMRLDKILNLKQENKTFGKVYDRQFIEWMQLVSFLKVHKQLLKKEGIIKPC